MQTNAKIILLLVTFLLGPACQNANNTEADTGTTEQNETDNSNSDGDADGDGDGDSDGDADSDSDTDSDADGDSDGDSDTDTDADSDGDSDGDADTTPDSGDDTEQDDTETDDETSTDSEIDCPEDAKCCTEHEITLDDIDCTTDAGVEQEDCLEPCGPAVEWQTDFTCPDGTTCAAAGCDDTDGADGYCIPSHQLYCDTVEDCLCLPTPCPEPIAWYCIQHECVPEIIDTEWDAMLKSLTQEMTVFTSDIPM